jgi:diguanylate cyclase (GGDEF)-like protein
MLLQKILDPPGRITRYVIVVFAFTLYVGVFTRFHDDIGMAVTSLGIFPVIVGSWYFGVGGGILTTFMSILADIGALLAFDRSVGTLFDGTGYAIGNIILIFIAVIVGRMATVLRERNESIIKLRELEEERRKHSELLESLHEITSVVLEARDLKSAVQVLLEKISRLFRADDGYLVLWDDVNQKPIPFAAYGSMKDIYPKMDLEGSTLTRYLLEVKRPLGISDVKNSPHVNPALLSKFPTESVLGLPLIAQGRRLALLYLGYNRPRSFSEKEIARAEIAARQVALALTKIQLIEDAQKQVRQLTALHEVAIIATEAENLDQLIERVTEVIGKSLFPDNFGILLMDGERGMLRPHPSYRFVARDKGSVPDVPLGQGVSGQVARTGAPLRIGNIWELDNYLNIDPQTVSELCVPIKIKDHVLGVINTESSRQNMFTPDDEALLGTLAGQLATAIEQLRSKEAERRWLDQLAHSNDLIYSLAHVTTHIEKALDADEIVQTLGEELQKIGIVCAIAFYDREKNRFTFAYTSMDSQILTQFENGIGFRFINFSVSFDSLRAAMEAKDPYQPAVVNNPQAEMQIFFTQNRGRSVSNILRGVGIDEDAELMRLPLMFENQLLGILWVWGKGIVKADLPVMSIFAKQIGISLERAQLFAEVQSLALTDPLTRLHNRRSLFELGKIEFARAQRMNRPFCCMMLDLDHFKQVNDNYGHQVGDQVLQEFAMQCKHSVREVDLVGRYGGEEIMILMPETDLQTAVQVAERLRHSIAETPIRVSGQELNLTVSIGVAAKDANTQQMETLIARADQAMYIAKHKGRNRVAVSK